MPLFALVSLLSCQSGQTSIPMQPLQLVLEGPEYGVFTGEDTVRVHGQVSLPGAVVTVENREVVVGTDGSFDVEVPIAGAYRNIDVRAFYFEQELYERVPVFSGGDPIEAWPGGMGVRLTPRLFRPLADSIAQQIDESEWAASLLDVLGEGFETDNFRLAPVDLRHRPTEVSLIPTDDGLVFEVLVRDLILDLDLGFTLNEEWVDAPSWVGFEELRLTASAALDVDEQGLLSLSLGDPDIVLSAPVVQLGPVDGSFLDFAVQGIGDLLVGIGDFALGALLGAVGEVPLGGPIAFETDLLGTSFEVSLADLGTDDEGVFLDLGLGLGDPIPEPLIVHRPTLEEGGPTADVIVALHEGLFASLVDSDLLDLLAQDLELGGFLGAGLGLVFTNLPGGNDAPDADAWCVQVAPGSARTARMGDSLSNVATLYLPDLGLDVGITHDGIDCDPWLEASLALEVSFVAQGSALTFDIAAPDGAIYYYGAEGSFEDQDVIEGLSGLFDVLLGLVGGQLEIDLADLLGEDLLPGVEGTDPRMTGIFPILDAEGAPVDGLFALSLDLL